MLRIFYISALIASISGGFIGYYSDHSEPAKDTSSTELINSYKVADNFSMFDIKQRSIPPQLHQQQSSQNSSMN